MLCSTFSQERCYRETIHVDEQQVKFCSGSSVQLQENEVGNSLKEGLSCLANYGAEVEPGIITHGRGVYIYTESGQRILDWTSGQVRSLI